MTSCRLLDARQVFALPDGQTICVARKLGGVDFQDLRSGAVLRTIRPPKGQQGGFHGVKLAPDGTRLLTWTAGRFIMWDAPTGKQLYARDLPDVTAYWLADGAFHPDGKTFAIATHHGTAGAIFIHDTATGKPLSTIPTGCAG